MKEATLSTPRMAAIEKIAEKKASARAVADQKIPVPHQTVYIVDDDDAARESLYWLITSAGHPAESFASADEFLEALGPNPSGCALIDVRMPGMSGLKLQELLRERGGSLAVIIITGHADVSIAVRAMKAGAADLVEKPFNDQAIIDLVAETLKKSAAAEQKLARKLEIDRCYRSLSGREEQVFERLAAGQSNKVIAADLNLSQKTIEIHRSKVMRKMKARSFAELVGMAAHMSLAKDISRPSPTRDGYARRRGH